jgi:hypothetical protein
MKTYRINVSSISWIDGAGLKNYSPNPLADEGWIGMLGYGMYGTRNDPPPSQFDGAGFVTGTTLSKQFRAVTSATIYLTVDDNNNFQGIRSSDPVYLDPGYTPPYRGSVMKWVGALGTELIAGDAGISRKMIDEANRFSPGEMSSNSKGILPMTINDKSWHHASVERLPYSNFTPPADQKILGSVMIKFRAGIPGDYIGIMALGSPNHVPWVWCEWMLTYGNGKLYLYCAGSSFPSHRFYINGKQHWQKLEDGSKNNLRSVFTSGKKAVVKTESIPTYGGGMGMSMPIIINTLTSKQAPLAEAATGSPVYGQAYTVRSGTYTRMDQAAIALGSLTPENKKPATGSGR